MALETELGSGEKGMLNRSSCLELPGIKSLKTIQKVKYKNLGGVRGWGWGDQPKNREQYFRTPPSVEAERGKYLLQLSHE